jgi:RNA polymerase sigma factor (sigma-70 family)
LKTNYKEEELIGHVLSGDPRRFGILYDHFAPSLYGVIRQIVKDEDLAQDILQESFLKIWNASSTYDPVKSRLFTWMLNISRNHAIDHIRSKQGKFERKQLVEDLSFLKHHDGANDTKHEHIGLKNIVGNLKSEQKIIINMAFFEGYTQSEIAERLQIPLGTVKTRYRNALSLLKDALKERSEN